MFRTITGKLALALALALTVLALAVGFSFSALFSQYSRESDRERLQNQSRVILSLVNAGMQEGSGRGQMRGSAGYRRYLQALNSQADIDAWVVDRGGNITTGYQQAQGVLPEGSLSLIQSVLAGEGRFLEGFSNQLGLPTLTLGVPILRQGSIEGALLLHTPLEALRQAQAAGLRTLLVSVAIGLALSLLVSLFLVRRYSRPLKQVRATALSLAEGDYNARTGILQRDEVGELAQAVDTLSARLDQARAERRDAERLRQDFMANVSHELKTPVAVLRAMLETLRDGLVTEPDKTKAYYDAMLDETSALDALIRDQMELSRLQTSGFSLTLEPLDLRQTALDALRSAQAMAEQKGVTLASRLPDAPVMIEGDVGRLRQMLMIILDNALRFAPKGSEVRLTMDQNSLSVQDAGPGIPEDSLPRVFERFYRVPGGEKGPGSGLGLAIAREISQRHGMTITAANRKEGGAVFRVGWIKDAVL